MGEKYCKCSYLAWGTEKIKPAQQWTVWGTKKGQAILVLFAEREGFEPSVQLPIQRFSRPSHSTALAPLQLHLNYSGLQK